MASNKNSGGNTGTVNVSELVANANSAQSTAQENLLTARATIVGNMETSATELATIDQTLATMGFDGELVAPNLSASILTAPAPKRRGRPRTKTAAPASDGVRGSKNMPLEDAICHALAQSEAGLPGGDGMSLGGLVEACQAAPVNYTFSGKASNHKTIVSQRMGGDEGLIETGFVEQVAIEGRSRGLPYRLTSHGRKWVKANPAG